MHNVRAADSVVVCCSGVRGDRSIPRNDYNNILYVPSYNNNYIFIRVGMIRDRTHIISAIHSPEGKYYTLFYNY